LKTERQSLPKHITSEEVTAAGKNADTVLSGRNINKVTGILKIVSYVIKYLPDIQQLKEDLKDPKNIIMYRKYGSYVGSPESVNYIHEKLSVDPEKKNT
jgi:hypothetical protein